MLKLQFNTEEIAPRELGERRLTIGREEANDLVLDDPTVSGFHAEIQVENGNLYLVDLGSTNGTQVNGQTITGRRLLSAWNILQFGEIRAEIVDTDQRRPTVEISAAIDGNEKAGMPGDANDTPPQGWSLTGKSTEVSGKVFPITGSMVIGRSPECKIVLLSQQVSSRHAELCFVGKQLLVKDLGSLNGTYVNGRKVSEMSLATGDEVRFDEVVFKVAGPKPDIAKTVLRPVVDPSKTQVNPAVDNNKTQVNPAINGAATMVNPVLVPQLVGSGRLAGQSFSLQGEKRSVGRTVDNDIAVDETTVSARHGQLLLIDGSWWVEDLGSRNGTFVGGRKIEKEKLKDGDTVSFGQANFVFEDKQQTVQGTSIMDSVSVDQEPTAVLPSSTTRTVPAWAWGAGGFACVALLAGIFFILRSSGVLDGMLGNPIFDAPVQGGTVWEQQLEGGRSGPATPLLADINGDNMLDVVVVDANGYLTAFDGEKGLKIFTAMAADKILAPPVAAKLSGGAGTDIVVSSNTGKVTAYNGLGKVLWTSPGELDLGEIINRCAVAELNGDTIPDLVIPTEKRGLVALDGGRGWEIWNTAEMFDGPIVNAPLKGDVNDDNIMDFVGITGAGRMVAISADGGKAWKIWEAQLAQMSYGSPVLLVAGEQKLVIVPTSGNGVMAINGKNGRLLWTANLEKEFFASPVVTDANGDQIPDVVVVSTAGDIHVLDGRNGDEIWSTALGVQVSSTPAPFETNGDGLEDLIVLDADSNILVIDTNRGRVQLTLNVSDAGGFIASPVLGDVNGDGLLNIVSASRTGKISTVFLNRPVSKGAKIWPEFLGGI